MQSLSSQTHSDIVRKQSRRICSHYIGTEELQRAIVLDIRKIEATNPLSKSKTLETGEGKKKKRAPWWLSQLGVCLRLGS